MIEYIKKLRICIRWYMELEDGYLAELEKLRNELDSEEKRHGEIGIIYMETHCNFKIWQDSFRKKNLMLF